MKPCQKSDRPAEIPDAVHMAAYEVYCHCYGAQPALIEGWCRGGFGMGELIAFLYARAFPRSEWRDRVREAFATKEVPAQVPGSDGPEA